MKARKIRNADESNPLWAILCPGCNEPHTIDSRWTFSGDADSPTFRPSLHVKTDDSCCHSFVTAGRIKFLADCSHALAGQTVDLPDVTNWGKP